jgi:hypothetical protein
MSKGEDIFTSLSKTQQLTKQQYQDLLKINNHNDLYNFWQLIGKDVP